MASDHRPTLQPWSGSDLAVTRIGGVLFSGTSRFEVPHNGYEQRERFLFLTESFPKGKPAQFAIGEHRSDVVEPQSCCGGLGRSDSPIRVVIDSQWGLRAANPFGFESSCFRIGHRCREAVPKLARR